MSNNGNPFTMALQTLAGQIIVWTIVIVGGFAAWDDANKRGYFEVQRPLCRLPYKAAFLKCHLYLSDEIPPELLREYKARSGESEPVRQMGGDGARFKSQ